MYIRRSHRSDPKYAQRTPMHAPPRTRVLRWRMQWRSEEYAPRKGIMPSVRARLSLYKRLARAAESFVHFLSSLSRFASICVPEIPRSPGIILEPRSKSRDPEDPEKCGSRAEALPARSLIFVEIFQICWGLLLLQAVVLSDHLLIKWVYTTFHKHDNNTRMVWVY